MSRHHRCLSAASLATTLLATTLLATATAQAQSVRSFRCDDGVRPFVVNVTVVNQQTISVQNLDGRTRTMALAARLNTGWAFSGGNYSMHFQNSQTQASLTRPNSGTIPCVLARGGPAPGPQPQPQPQPRPPGNNPGNSVNASAMLQAINAYRQQSGAAPVRLDGGLAGAALSHSRTMASTNNFSHDAGGSFGQRMAGIGARGAVENIAMGQRSIPEVMQSWANSPGHAANMRNPNMRRMGIAKVGPYWTLIMAQ